MPEAPAPKPKLSVVVPVYDSEVLVELTNSLEEVLSERFGDAYEIIFVDDSSPAPEVWPILEELAGARSVVRAVQLTRNFGQQAATLCGLEESRGELVLTMDDDLQHDPRDIPRLLECEGADVVIGQFLRKHHSLFKRVTSRIKGVFDRLIVGKPKGIQMSSFRLLRRNVVDGVLSIRTPKPFIPALIFHVSKNVVGVVLEHHPRRTGRSGYTLWKLIGVFSNLIFNNSSLVLRIVGQIGMAFAAVSFFLAALVAYRKLAYDMAIQGWTSLIATQLLIGGLLLFSVGVVGEYLIRIIETTEARPTYLVRQRIG